MLPTDILHGVLNPQLTSICPCPLLFDRVGNQGKDPGQVRGEPRGQPSPPEAPSGAPAARGRQNYPWAPASLGLVTQCFRLILCFSDTEGDT